ncbi:Uncharacterised protein [Vibrio metschnikovii]|nr:Uncharacterised protein [Vibrio metschnikovii]SUP47224.1 Uncharacterised protein [Vibrio metschnikovii]
MQIDKYTSVAMMDNGHPALQICSNKNHSYTIVESEKSITYISER